MLVLRKILEPMAPRVRSRLPRSVASALRAAAVALAASLVGATGCAAILGFEETTLRTADGEGGTLPDGAPDPDATTLPDGGSASRLTTKPASLVVRRGAATEITFELARGSEVTGAVTVRLSDLPAGVTAAPVVLASDVSSGTLKLTAVASAALGAKIVKLITDGTALPPSEIPLLVADPSGALDVTFDSDGLVSDATRGTGATFAAVKVQADQRIVAAGSAGLGAPQPLSGWIVRRYAVNGVPDTAFNAAAVGLPADGELRAIAIDANGKIVCVGSSLVAAALQLAVLRLNANGTLDTTFAPPTGVARVDETPGGSVGLGVAVQADGAVVVVGSRSDIVGNESGIITRFKADGTRDPAFSAGATIAVPSTRFIGVTLEGGAVLAAGSSIGGPLPSYVLTRRTAQGAVDQGFGTAGTATFANTFRANAFALLPDGSLAMAGDVAQGTAGYTAAVATAKGAPVFARGYGNAPGAGFYGLAAQSDGRVVAAGHIAAINGEARVDRLLADGNRDTTFGSGGTAVLEPATVANGVEVTLFGAAVQADGRILVVGNRAPGGAVLYRLWP